MPFYKVDNEQLLSGTSVMGPGFMLVEEDKDVYEYPVEGWYWFADLTTAMAGWAGMKESSEGYSCTPWQIRKVLTQMGIRQAVEDAVTASTDQELKDGWEFASEFRSDDPFVLAMGSLLGKTEAEVVSLIQFASGL